MAIVGPILISIENGERRTFIDDAFIHCRLGEKKGQILKASQEDIYISFLDFSDKDIYEHPEHKTGDLRDACGITHDVVMKSIQLRLVCSDEYVGQVSCADLIDELYPEFKEEISAARIAGYSNAELGEYLAEKQPDRSLYTVEPLYKTTGGFLYTLGLSTLYLLCVIFVFEFVRRCFYYVVLGSFRAK